MNHEPYDKKLNHPPDFIVEYKFISSELGGRKTDPPVQGYRPDFLYDHKDRKPNQMYMIWPEFLDTKGEVILDKSNPVSESGRARMWIVNSEMKELHKDNIKLGLTGYFMEGGTKVAECTVIKIVGLNEEKK